MAISGFAEFWPQYVRAHSRDRTRLLHAIGSVLAVVMLGVAFAISLWFLIAVPIVGYAFAWYAHFFVEKNRPQTFAHPFYSVLADYRMTFLMMPAGWKGRSPATRRVRPRTTPRSGKRRRRRDNPRVMMRLRQEVHPCRC